VDDTMTCLPYTVTMFSIPALDTSDAQAFYDALTGQLTALLGDEPDPTANMANMSALLAHTMPDLNWAGFYLLRGGELVLGPFQGKPACVRIEVGRGVCGTAVEHNASMLVDDVHAFPGHIACDADSRSELVVPVRQNGCVIGVLDLDSPRPGRFTSADQEGVEQLVHVLEATLTSRV
jgi:L-methionine (R)-S-oxide reductase